jgi:hypothetical protein
VIESDDEDVVDSRAQKLSSAVPQSSQDIPASLSETNAIYIYSDRPMDELRSLLDEDIRTWVTVKSKDEDGKRRDWRTKSASFKRRFLECTFTWTQMEMAHFLRYHNIPFDQAIVDDLWVEEERDVKGAYCVWKNGSKESDGSRTPGVRTPAPMRCVPFPWAFDEHGQPRSFFRTIVGKKSRDEVMVSILLIALVRLLIHLKSLPDAAAPTRYVPGGSEDNAACTLSKRIATVTSNGLATSIVATTSTSPPGAAKATITPPSIVAASTPRRSSTSAARSNPASSPPTSRCAPIPGRGRQFKNRAAKPYPSIESDLTQRSQTNLPPTGAAETAQHSTRSPAHKERSDGELVHALDVAMLTPI